MRRHGIGLFLIVFWSVSPGFAQSNATEEPAKVAPPNPATAPTPPSGLARPQTVDPATEFPPDLPVVTFVGPCDAQQKTPPATKGCKTTLTRADIDAVINTLAPTAPSSVRRQLGLNYSRLAAASALSETLKLEKNPAIQKQIQIQQKLVRMQILANALYSQIETRTNDVRNAEVERYYEENKANFVRGDVSRLTIPKSVLLATKPEDVVALKTLAESYRTRAVVGEDIDQLQQQVVSDLGLKMSLPPTKIKTRPASLTAAEKGVFDLEPGQVTPIIESGSAFTILKLDSKQPIPLETAKPEIMMFLQHDQAQGEIAKVAAAADVQVNLEYFGLMVPPEILPPPQVTGVSLERSAQANLPQRAVAHRPVMPPKH